MRISADTYLIQVNRSNEIRSSFRRICLTLSLLVVLGVFWGLKLTGITMAGEAFCGMEEHVHSEDCAQRVLICDLEEDSGHTHGEDCLHRQLYCGIPEQEGHTHNDDCMGRPLTCDLAEEEAHSHDEDCYVQEIGCGQEESDEHIHDEGCMISQLVCEIPETPGHIHEDGCYSEEPAPLCGLEEIEAHFHTDECYLVEEGIYDCGLEESEGHSHTDACFEIMEGCAVEEHIHTPNCYSDLSADLETKDDWDASVADIISGPSTAENILMVVQSQLGESESIRNFYVDEFGVRRGISRYGQWYGNPYGDWSAMFVSFCLDYAGVKDLPVNAGPEAMRLDWEKEGMYTPAAEHEPQAGQIVFLDKDGNGAADGVAIVTGVKDKVLVVAEGDTVEQVTQIGSVMLYPEEPSEEAAAEELPEEPPVEPAAEAVPEEPPEEPAAEAVPEESPEEPAAEEIPEEPAEEPIAEELPEEPAEEPIAEELPEEPAEEPIAEEVPEEPAEEPIAEELPDEPAEDPVAEELPEEPAEDPAAEEVPEEPAEEPIAEELPEEPAEEPAAEEVPEESPEEPAAEEIPEEPELPADRVLETLYSADDPAVMGYGLVPFKKGLMLAASPRAASYTVWLDGTNGGLMGLDKSPNRAYTAQQGSKFTLPEEWASPEQYSYTLRGWYDVTNSVYYAPGEQVTVNGNMVFYADWEASTYDIGQFNSQVADTVSTNDFVTIRMFDYSILFNALSESVRANISGSSHTETWSLITNGNNPYNGEYTLNYIFRDWDQGNRDISYPANTNSHNTYDASVDVHRGLYTPYLRDLLFGTDNSFDPYTKEGVIGKEYLGTADHLFSLMTDPNDPYYGYYYYNSQLNAASYNQSDERFYVYDYLERATDSMNDSGAGQYSDFLPLNSPYVNTNGGTPTTYRYNGANGEYAGVNHYMYEAKTENKSQVRANYLFGMNIDIDFYLPNAPGEGGNKDLYGRDMHFKFSGDDDVWVLIDDTLVLDLGGIHGIESGDINFSTGEVSINGVRNAELSRALSGISAGDHTLKMYYLERGSSQSNCAVYFNLAPRYRFQIQKEDVLTRDVLNGAQFSVFTDPECTVPAALWTSEAAHDAGYPASNVFTVQNGVADMWGMCAGNTYYIKETHPPDAEGYGIPNGIIELKFDMYGFITYQVHVTEENGKLTPGFTVHGIKMDEENQSAFIVATNIKPVENQEPTEIGVRKRWDDNLDHSGDSVTVYLTVTDPDGTVRRIREIVLSERIDWTYVWENLPKYDTDGNEIVYGVQEALVPGYVGRVEEVESWDTGTGGGSGGSGDFVTAGSFENGQTYLLSTRHGYLAVDNQGLTFQSGAEAANSADVQWVASVNSDGTVTLKTLSGQTLYYTNYTFRASSSPGQNKNLRFENNRLYCYLDHGGWSETLYPIDENLPGNLVYNHMLYTTGNSAQALVITPQKLTVSEPEPPPVVEGTGLYQITNTPAGKAVTSLTVQKVWDTGGYGGASLYETLNVRIKLLANGIDSGMSGVANLKNNWTYTFRDLPMYDSDGNQISYSVEEIPISDEWRVTYGEITSSGGQNPTYSTTVTNTYFLGGPELPSTGTAARMMYILCGGSMMLFSLVYGFLSRRKRERRME